MLPTAISFAQEMAATPNPLRKTRDMTDRLGEATENEAALKKLSQLVSQKARGQIAPQKAIEAVGLAATLPFTEAIERESEIFQELLLGDQSRALVHVFFGERAVAKIPNIAADTTSREIKTAAVVGAGTMGSGIALTYLAAGIPVVLKEVAAEQLQRGVETIRKQLTASVERGRITQAQAEQQLAALTPTLDYQDLSKADVIVEAVFEAMHLKQEVFAELDRVAKPSAILATNTSTLDVDQIASATRRPESVIGHHFFSPANIMRLLEVVRGSATSDEVIVTSMALAKRLSKVAVLVGNCFGFVGNRMFWPYQREAQFLLEEGASVEQVDRVLADFGMAMGPNAVMDLAGIDVGWRVDQERKDSLPEGLRQPLVSSKLYELNRYGQKTGAGWYRYEGRKALPDPAVQTLIESTAQAAGIERRTITDAEILERTLYALVNEGAHFGRGHCGATGRHRHYLRLRLRLSSLARWPDDVCRYRRTTKDLPADVSLPRDTRSVVGTRTSIGRASKR
ncbi:MAG: 3-hydroxyacyl-CoA dehydrogenase family protein [Pirellulaceae bacterium]